MGLPQKWMVYKCLEWKIMEHPAVLLHSEINNLEVPPHLGNLQMEKHHEIVTELCG